EKERELLNYDLENVKRALGNVLKRVSLLESRENATLKKRLAETETKLVWAHMERDTAERRIMPPKAMSEARMREVIMEQVTASMAEFVANINRGASGAGAGGAGASGRALTWWNGRIDSIGIDAANGTLWTETGEVSEGEKRKGEGDRGGHGDNRRDYNRRQTQRRANAGAMTNVAPNDNEVCPKCKNKKHSGDCWKC
nr:hypothetical protein [Tanacetum cinerariifolium]